MLKQEKERADKQKLMLNRVNIILNQEQKSHQVTINLHKESITSFKNLTHGLNQTNNQISAELELKN